MNPTEQEKLALAKNYLGERRQAALDQLLRVAHRIKNCDPTVDADQAALADLGTELMMAAYCARWLRELHEKVSEHRSVQEYFSFLHDQSMAMRVTIRGNGPLRARHLLYIQVGVSLRRRLDELELPKIFPNLE